jgi:hypothetical protein
MSILRYFITSKAKRNLLKFFFTNEGAYYTREVARLTGEPLNAARRELGYLEKAGMLHSYMKGNQKYYEVVATFPLLAEWKTITLGTDDTPTASRRKTATPAARPPVHVADAPMQIEKPVEPADIRPIVPGAEVIMNRRPVKAETDAAGGTAAPQPQQADKDQPALTVSSFIDYLKEQFNDISTIVLAIIHGEATKSEQIPETGVDLLVVGDIDKDSLLEMVGTIEDSTGVGINLTRMTRSDFDYRNAKGDPLMRRMWGEKKLVVKGRH